MTVADRCPGVLRPHPAEDGLLIRLRIPGGQTTGAAVGAVSQLAARYGNADLQLTTRSGLQLRGLPDPIPSELVGRLSALGFLPSRRHDRVRNVVASPLTGLGAGADLRPMIRELDRLLVADAELAELPGRFLFALDDGTDDVSRLPFDLGYRAASAEAGEVLIGSTRHRIAVSAGQAPPALIRLARAFLAASRTATGRAWHVTDLPEWIDAQTGRPADDVSTDAPPVEPPLGIVSGAASIQVPLGLLTPAQAAAVAAVAGTGPVVVTPWRGLILPGRGSALPAMVESGLVADASSGWALVSACVGAPHCGRTTLDTRAAATAAVRAGVTERLHLSGCGRRCGAPSTPHQELVGS